MGEAALGRLFELDRAAKGLLVNVRKLARTRGVFLPSGAGESLCDDDLELHLDWTVDAEKRTKIPSRLFFVQRKAALLRNVPKLIEVLSAQHVAKRPDTAKTDELLRLFLQANGHDLGDAHLLQDAIPVAYAMLVIHRELHLTEARGGLSLRELVSGSFPELAGEVATIG